MKRLFAHGAEERLGSCVAALLERARHILANVDLFGQDRSNDLEILVWLGLSNGDDRLRAVRFEVGNKPLEKGFAELRPRAFGAPSGVAALARLERLPDLLFRRCRFSDDVRHATPSG